MILMRHSKLEEDKGFSKVKGIYIVFRMCACEGANPTNNRCPYRCLSAPINHTIPKVPTVPPPALRSLNIHKVV